MDTLDEVRRESWREAYDKVKALKDSNPRKPGRPKEDDLVMAGKYVRLLIRLIRSKVHHMLSAKHRSI